MISDVVESCPAGFSSLTGVATPILQKRLLDVQPRDALHESRLVLRLVRKGLVIFVPRDARDRLPGHAERDFYRLALVDGDVAEAVLEARCDGGPHDGYVGLGEEAGLEWGEGRLSLHRLNLHLLSVINHKKSPYYNVHNLSRISSLTIGRSGGGGGVKGHRPRQIGLTLLYVLFLRGL